MSLESANTSQGHLSGFSVPCCGRRTLRGPCPQQILQVAILGALGADAQRGAKQDTALPLPFLHTGRALPTPSQPSPCQVSRYVGRQTVMRKIVKVSRDTRGGSFLTGLTIPGALRLYGSLWFSKYFHSSLSNKIFVLRSPGFCPCFRTIKS